MLEARLGRETDRYDEERRAGREGGGAGRVRMVGKMMMMMMMMMMMYAMGVYRNRSMSLLLNQCV